MNRHRMLGVAVVTVAAAASVTISALLTSGHSVSLPLPQTAAHQKLPFNGGSNATGSATYTNTPPTPLTGCTLSLSKFNSRQGPDFRDGQRPHHCRRPGANPGELFPNPEHPQRSSRCWRHRLVLVADYPRPTGDPGQVSATATLGATHIACNPGSPRPRDDPAYAEQIPVPVLPTNDRPRFCRRATADSGSSHSP